MKGVLRATEGAAPWCSVVEMNSHEEALTSSDGRRERDFEVAMKVGTMTCEEVMIGCGSKA